MAQSTYAQSLKDWKAQIAQAEQDFRTSQASAGAAEHVVSFQDTDMGFSIVSYNILADIFAENLNSTCCAACIVILLLGST
jgi:hypothetical protein